MAGELSSLLGAFIASDPRLEIWRRYPDVTEAEDACTDGWACHQVSAEFAAYARAQGWHAVVIHGTDPAEPFADEHFWVRLHREGGAVDVDWTARQYHNLFQEQGHDPRVLGMSWPLVWEPHRVAHHTHPVVGPFATIILEDG